MEISDCNSAIFVDDDPILDYWGQIWNWWGGLRHGAKGHTQYQQVWIPTTAERQTYLSPITSERLGERRTSEAGQIDNGRN